MVGLLDQTPHTKEPGANIPSIKIHQDKFRQQVIVITGAANGIGEATSRLFAAQGADLAIIDLQAQKLESLKRDLSEFDVDVQCFVCDVSSESDVNDTIAKIIEHFGHIEVLVHLAGIYPYTPLDKATYEDYQRVMKVNMDSCFLFTRAVLPHMRKACYGRIINTSSNTVQLAPAGLSAYVTAKAAIIGFTRVTAFEAGPGITANVIIPGLTLTESSWQAGLLPDGSRPVFETMLARQAIKRFGLPDDIAHTISFIASPEAQFTTAQQFDVSGGATLY